MRTQKHKILSIIVLNMAKYIIISLIFIYFVPIFFIFNLFRDIPLQRKDYKIVGYCRIREMRIKLYHQILVNSEQLHTESTPIV